MRIVGTYNGIPELTVKLVERFGLHGTLIVAGVLFVAVIGLAVYLIKTEKV